MCFNFIVNSYKLVPIPSEFKPLVLVIGGFYFYFCVMENSQPNNPLHGVTLQLMLEQLVAYYGFDTLGELIKIRCFNHEPSIKSSLTFLRKTEWARKQVESLYIKTLPKL